MTESKHTPAPWHIERCPCQHNSCNDWNVNGWFMQGGMVKEANARLIAAAPTLYSFVATLAESGNNEALKIIQEIDNAL